MVNQSCTTYGWQTTEEKSSLVGERRSKASPSAGFKLSYGTYDFVSKMEIQDLFSAIFETSNLWNFSKVRQFRRLELFVQVGIS